MLKNSGDEGEPKDSVYSAGGFCINHLSSLCKSIVFPSGSCRYHALGVHCQESIHLLHGSQALALTSRHTRSYIVLSGRETHSWPQALRSSKLLTQPRQFWTRKPSWAQHISSVQDSSRLQQYFFWTVFFTASLEKFVSKKASSRVQLMQGLAALITMFILAIHMEKTCSYISFSHFHCSHEKIVSLSC